MTPTERQTLKYVLAQLLQISKAGCGSKEPMGITQVLVFGSMYHAILFWYYFFEPQPNLGSLLEEFGYPPTNMDVHQLDPFGRKGIYLHRKTFSFFSRMLKQMEVWEGERIGQTYT